MLSWDHLVASGRQSAALSTGRVPIVAIQVWPRRVKQATGMASHTPYKHQIMTSQTRLRDVLRDVAKTGRRAAEQTGEPVAR